MVAKAAENTRTKKPKIAMTWPLLAELKKSIDQQSPAKMDAHCKRLLWAVSLTCMVGTFRLGEILPSKTKLGPKGKLLGGLKRTNIRRMKVRINGKHEDMFLTRILETKERRTGAGAAVDVEIFANKGTYCAVSALDSLFDGAGDGADWAFTFSDVQRWFSTDEGHLQQTAQEDVETSPGLQARLRTFVPPRRTYNDGEAWIRGRADSKAGAVAELLLGGLHCVGPREQVERAGAPPQAAGRAGGTGGQGGKTVQRRVS